MPSVRSKRGPVHKGRAKPKSTKSKKRPPGRARLPEAPPPLAARLRSLAPSNQGTASPRTLVAGQAFSDNGFLADLPQAKVYAQAPFTGSSALDVGGQVANAAG